MRWAQLIDQLGKKAEGSLLRIRLKQGPGVDAARRGLPGCNRVAGIRKEADGGPTSGIRKRHWRCAGNAGPGSEGQD
jgi:hypothetical protein